jgi:dGTPase
MFRRVYLASPAQDEDSRVGFVIEQLYKHFMEHPEDVPDDLRAIAERNGDPHECAVIDYIAGMTDPYALKVFHAIYVPRIWSG